MSAPQPNAERADDHYAELTNVIRRVIRARVRDSHLVEDLVQETLVRVMAAQSRIEAAALIPYALVTARNLIASLAQRDDRAKRHAHLLVDWETPDRPEDEVLKAEQRTVVGEALARLSTSEREALVAHEVDGEDTATLAASRGSTPGAIAAQLNRTRAKLRVEYLLALERVQLPTDRCRPVLLALSSGDRRRQRELDTAGHLLECSCCATLSEPLLDRRHRTDDGETRISIESDADVVKARQKGREVAARIGFSTTELTLIATAISEITRNIVRFAHRGEVMVSLVTEDDVPGVTIVARDSGPGIADISCAIRDGFSSYGGLGLGLPGCRRLMDEFEIVSEVGKGTTVTMTKWRR